MNTDNRKNIRRNKKRTHNAHVVLPNYQKEEKKATWNSNGVEKKGKRIQ